MKIWLLQDHLRSGGTERQTILLAKEFTAAGHAVEVVTFRPGGALAPTLAPLVPRVLQPFDTTFNWFAPGLLSAARRAAPDVVVCMGRMANAHSGRLVRALPATRVVATLRTGKALPGPFRRSLSVVAHIVANSRESAELLARIHGVPSTKISVIHNALVFPPDAEPPSANANSNVTAAASPALASPALRPLRAAQGASASTVVLLCVGMFRPEKNQADLLRALAALTAPPSAECRQMSSHSPGALALAPAFAHVVVAATVPDWQLWFVGDGPERASCARLAASLGLADRVRFLGFQSDPAAAYRSADLAVLASRAESLSNFLIEAQAHGLPVIATEVGGVRECCRPGITGDIVPAGNPAAFLAALRPWLADPARRRAAAPLARAFAREAFDPTRQAAAYLALFARLRKSGF